MILLCETHTENGMCKARVGNKYFILVSMIIVEDCLSGWAQFFFTKIYLIINSRWDYYHQLAASITVQLNSTHQTNNWNFVLSFEDFFVVLVAFIQQRLDRKQGKRERSERHAANSPTLRLKPGTTALRTLASVCGVCALALSHVVPQTLC